MGKVVFSNNFRNTEAKVICISPFLTPLTTSFDCQT